MKGKAAFGSQEWLAGEIGYGNYNYYFFIFFILQALAHSDDISIISHMLEMIIIWAVEDAGKVHTANELQHIQTTQSQTFLSSLTYIFDIQTVSNSFGATGPIVV